MNRSRVRVWRDRWGLLLAGTFLCVATMFFIARITSWLPDSVLFCLKLISFLVTAGFGAAGFITDFKDDQKKLTPAGKLNLAGLVVAAAIGITVQTAQYKNNIHAAENTRKENAELRRQNEVLLTQVNRGLEPIGETVKIRYTLKVPLAQSGFQGLAELLQNQMKQLTSASPSSSSEHTSVIHISQPSQPNRYVATFDRDSPLMPRDQYQKGYLSQPPFGISLYRSRPAPLGGCGNVPPMPDIELVFDDTATTERSTPYFLSPAKWKGVVLVYDTTSNYLAQYAEGIFQIRSKNPRLVSTFDLSQFYVRLFPLITAPQGPQEFTDVTILIGQRSFAIPTNELVSDDCGVIIYRLPTIASTSK